MELRLSYQNMGTWYIIGFPFIVTSLSSLTATQLTLQNLFRILDMPWLWLWPTSTRECPSLAEGLVPNFLGALWGYAAVSLEVGIVDLPLKIFQSCLSLASYLKPKNIYAHYIYIYIYIYHLFHFLQEPQTPTP